MTPRLIRLKDAPAYLGLDRRRFDEEVRPYLTEIREHGRKAVRFDRIELDRYADYTVAVCGHPPRRDFGFASKPCSCGATEEPAWEREREEERPALRAVAKSGGSTSASKGTVPSAKVLARRILQRRSAT